MQLYISCVFTHGPHTLQQNALRSLWAHPTVCVMFIKISKNTYRDAMVTTWQYYVRGGMYKKMDSPSRTITYFSSTHSLIHGHKMETNMFSSWRLYTNTQNLIRADTNWNDYPAKEIVVLKAHYRRILGIGSSTSLNELNKSNSKQLELHQCTLLHYVSILQQACVYTKFQNWKTWAEFYQHI